MILDDLTLYNFGLYADRQTVALTPPSPDKPVILFGGLNGGGKTTFLDALQLCLFGPHARISSRGSLAYPEYLSRCIHRGAAASEAGIEVSFHYTVEGHEDHYRLRRSWRRTDSGCKEEFTVLKNGHPEPALADNWATQVEEFLPANIAHLFLFDGEQIEGYASQVDSAALIGAAIQNLLGLDMVDQLEKDLHVFERRKRIEERDDAAYAEIMAVEAELRDLRSRITARKQERAALQTHQIDRKHRALASLEDKYRKLGGDLYEQKAEIERRLAHAEEAAKAGAVGLRELASGPLPLLLVRVPLESTEARDRHEKECRRARELSEVLTTRDRQALKHLRTVSADKTAIETLKAFLAVDRAQRQALGKKEIVLDLLPEVRSDLHAFLRGDLNDLRNEAQRRLRQQKKAAAEIARARAEYESVPGADIIADTVAERESLKKEIAALKAQHAAMGEDIERLEREIQRKEQSLMHLMEADAKTKGDREDRARILHHAVRVRTTLASFRRIVIERHVRRIEQLVLESYHQLLRKASLVTRLSIDPADFCLTLFGRDSDVLSAERLSAGERQLLAIALLWGLAKASGRPLPTAIDTPLGRLDTAHRMHVVERYLPFASHQVLILSTDEEIVGDYLECLRPWIGRTYELHYDDDADRTRIIPGYFEARKVA